MDSHELYNETFDKLVSEAAGHELHTEAATTAVKNLKTFSECRPPAPELEIVPDPVPTTAWERVKHGTARIWDNETTRVFLKAAGAFAGVWYVAHTTIQKDHVIERQAMNQANQRSI